MSQPKAHALDRLEPGHFASTQCGWVLYPHLPKDKFYFRPGYNTSVSLFPINEFRGIVERQRCVRCSRALGLVGRSS